LPPAGALGRPSATWGPPAASRNASRRGSSTSFGVRRLDPLHDGLGLLAGSACPHYDGEAQRRPTYRRLVAGGFPAGYAADDGAALMFAGTELTEVVTSRPGARAFRVERTDGGVVETPLAARFLGAAASR
jgi:hypothetical protein